MLSRLRTRGTEPDISPADYARTLGHQTLPSNLPTTWPSWTALFVKHGACLRVTIVRGRYNYIRRTLMNFDASHSRRR